ncbi:MAG: ATP-dependent helicase HrpB [Rhodanobacteraceae bacterium]
MDTADFPITQFLSRILASLHEHPRLVLEAPPGAGKTTRMPVALLDEAWLAGRKILMLEPRRLAARAAAEFMSSQLGEPVGQTIGYRIRFESRLSANTRIEVVTEGILTRMLQDDPELPAVGAILFDEFHERHLPGDLGAALALDVQASLRPDLRLIVMSATLDGMIGAIHGGRAPWFDAPVIRSEGRAYPVRIEHPIARRGEDGVTSLCRAVTQALSETDGDVLVFLPGRREIARAQRALALSLPPFTGEGAREANRGNMAKEPRDKSVRRTSPHPDPEYPHPKPPPLGEGIMLLPLHGDLSLAEQHAALAPRSTSAMDGTGIRRVILATNVAESSVTLPGIRAVIDTGLAREPRFDPNSGFTRLQTVNISQASADQRAGRAGRVAPGVAYRLWPQSQRLEPARTPEIALVELSGLALELAAWGSADDALRWLDPPPAGALAQARELLQRLGGLDDTRRITALGRKMLQLGATPRLAAAALRAPKTLHALIADLLALLEARSPLRGAFNDDLRMQVDALHAWRDAGADLGRRAPWREGGARAGREYAADAGALAAVEQASRGWRKRLDVRNPASGAPDALAVGNLLLHAFPDRVAKQDGRDPRRYVLANGRGTRLHEESALHGEAWLVAVELRFDTRDSLILTAAPFDPALLERDYSPRLQRERVVRINESNDVVEVFEERRFDAIVLSRRAVPVTADDALPALLAMIRARGIDALPWSDATRRLRSRIAWLRGAMPDVGLPDVTDAALLGTLEQWLAPTLRGKRKLDALSSAGLSGAFATLLDWQQRKLLDEHAPDALSVPSGMTRRLDYGDALQGETDRAENPRPSPVLAVKLQELFGMADTPRVACGRVPVTLHLLSPAGRPIQVTQDLRGFWERTYPEVKKELKGRYPKHPWPENPWSAVPTHRAKPRR